MAISFRTRSVGAAASLVRSASTADDSLLMLTTHPQAIKCIADVMAHQIELYPHMSFGEMCEADSVTASTFFLHRAKFDEGDTLGNDNLEQYSLILEVLDTLLDVWDAFSLADANGRGVLTEAQLAEACARVLGVSPKSVPPEVRRLIRSEGTGIKDFEIAMLERLRELGRLPILSPVQEEFILKSGGSADVCAPALVTPTKHAGSYYNRRRSSDGISQTDGRSKFYDMSPSKASLTSSTGDAGVGNTSLLMQTCESAEYCDAISDPQGQEEDGECCTGVQEQEERRQEILRLSSPLQEEQGQQSCDGLSPSQAGPASPFSAIHSAHADVKESSVDSEDCHSESDGCLGLEGHHPAAGVPAAASHHVQRTEEDVLLNYDSGSDDDFSIPSPPSRSGDYERVASAAPLREAEDQAGQMRVQHGDRERDLTNGSSSSTVQDTARLSSVTAPPRIHSEERMPFANLSVNIATGRSSRPVSGSTSARWGSRKGRNSCTVDRGTRSAASSPRSQSLLHVLNSGSAQPQNDPDSTQSSMEVNLSVGDVPLPAAGSSGEARAEARQLGPLPSATATVSAAAAVLEGRGSERSIHQQVESHASENHSLMDESREVRQDTSVSDLLGQLKGLDSDNLDARKDMKEGEVAVCSMRMPGCLSPKALTQAASDTSTSAPRPLYGDHIEPERRSELASKIEGTQPSAVVLLVAPAVPSKLDASNKSSSIYWHVDNPPTPNGLGATNTTLANGNWDEAAMPITGHLSLGGTLKLHEGGVALAGTCATDGDGDDCAAYNYTGGARREQSQSNALVLSQHGLERLALNDVESLTPGVLSNLLTLVLSCNRLQTIDGSVLAALPSLRHLNLSHNLLRSMEPSNGSLPQSLESLDMSHNALRRIEGIFHCKELTSLNLSHNGIRTVGGLERLRKLRHLDMGSNRVASRLAIRALSFNLALTSLVLEGCPIALQAGYRPTIICLLPHIERIDGHQLPPSPGHLARTKMATAASSTVPAPKSQPTAKQQREADERRMREYEINMRRRSQLFAAKQQAEASLSSSRGHEPVSSRRASSMAVPVQVRASHGRKHREVMECKDRFSKVGFGSRFVQQSCPGDWGATSAPKRRSARTSGGQRRTSTRSATSMRRRESGNGKAGAPADALGISIVLKSPSVRQWLEDVCHEAETSATALQVLLCIFDEGRASDAARLTSFRSTMKAVKLFNPTPPMPTPASSEGTVTLEMCRTVERRAIKTKNAVVNLLNVMEQSASAAQRNSPTSSSISSRDYPESLHKYVSFLRSQDDLMQNWGLVRVLEMLRTESPGKTAPPNLMEHATGVCAKKHEGSASADGQMHVHSSGRGSNHEDASDGMVPVAPNAIFSEGSASDISLVSGPLSAKEEQGEALAEVNGGHRQLIGDSLCLSSSSDVASRAFVDEDGAGELQDKDPVGGPKISVPEDSQLVNEPAVKEQPAEQLAGSPRVADDGNESSDEDEDGGDGAFAAAKLRLQQHKLSISIADSSEDEEDDADDDDDSVEDQADDALMRDAAQADRLSDPSISSANGGTDEEEEEEEAPAAGEGTSAGDAESESPAEVSHNTRDVNSDDSSSKAAETLDGDEGKMEIEGNREEEEEEALLLFESEPQDDAHFSPSLLMKAQKAEENEEQEIVASAEQQAEVTTTSSASAAAPDEPSSEFTWIEGFDKNHECFYYFNTLTGESSWYQPDEPFEAYVPSDDEHEEEEEEEAEATAAGPASIEAENERAEVLEVSVQLPEGQEQSRDEDGGILQSIVSTASTSPSSAAPGVNAMRSSQPADGLLHLSDSDDSSTTLDSYYERKYGAGARRSSRVSARSALRLEGSSLGSSSDDEG